MRTIEKIALMVVFVAGLVSVYGQEGDDDRKLKIDAGADLVSSYVWRGLYQTGASFQPSASLSVKGLTFGTWASTDFKALIKEVDFFFSYELKGFSLGLFDFWCQNEGESFFKDRKSHLFEFILGYSFPEKFPLSLELNTMFSGDDDLGDDGKRLYSTYITAGYPFTIEQFDCEVGIGITPWKGIYADHFNIATITAKATKKLPISSGYALPVYVELILAPSTDNIFVVFGITF